jgi:hypothetical protein
MERIYFLSRTSYITNTHISNKFLYTNKLYNASPGQIMQDEWLFSGKADQ